MLRDNWRLEEGRTGMSCHMEWPVELAEKVILEGRKKVASEDLS